MNKKTNRKTVSEVQVILTVLSVAALLISNTITAKQVQFPFGITMTSAVFIFPVTYILSDVFSEVYGYRWSRIAAWLGFAMNLLMVVFYEIAIFTPAPSYWGNQEAFQTVLGSAPRALVAGLAGYLVGGWMDDKVFLFLKRKHEHDNDGFIGRAILTSAIGEFFDSLIFIPLAFLGTMPLQTLLVMGVTQVCLKTGYEVIVSPLTRLVVKKVQAYEDGR